MLSTPGQRALAERVAALLGDARAGVFAGAAMHVPVETARAAARRGAPARRRRRGRDRRRLDDRPRQGDRARAGAAGRRDADDLRRQRDDADLRPHRRRPEDDRPRRARAAAHGRLRPRADARRCRSRITVASGINAIAHAAEALYAPDGNPVIDADGRGRHPRRSPPRCRALQRDPRDIEARGDALVRRPGSAARCSAASTMACTTSSATPSAAASTCRTPRRTRSCCRTRWPTTRRPPREAMARDRARARRAPSAPGAACSTSAGAHGAPTLAGGARHACEPTSTAPPTLAMQNPYPNPRPLERAAIRELLQRAFDGARPG